VPRNHKKENIKIKKKEKEIKNLLSEKNSTEDMKEKNIIAIYSARKSRTKGTDPNSVLKPDTNSLSPSEKSKGDRLVSAKITTNQKTTTPKKPKK